MRAHLFVIRNRTDGVPPASSIVPFGPRGCQIPLILKSAPYAERLLSAHRIAAEVRKRRGWIVERKT